MFTHPFLFGINLVSLGGFVVMALAYYLTRTRQARAPIAFSLMGIGTVLVFIGLYLAAPPGLPGRSEPSRPAATKPTRSR